MRAAAFALVAALGCGKHLNPEWCATHQDPSCEALPDAAGAGDAPATCATNADCASVACLPEGVCADASAVLYASPTGSGTACTAQAKCLLATAIGVATPARHVIALDPTVYPGNLTIDHSVQLLGRDATLEGTSTGNAVTIASGATVELDFLTITGATAGDGIACTQGTLIGRRLVVFGNNHGMTSSCTLTLERSLFHHDATGSLVLTSGTVDVRASMFVNNGSATLMGAHLAIGAGVVGDFAFNTVAYNVIKSSNSMPGMRCDASSLSLTGNLITDNLKGTAFGAAQVTGACDFASSYTQPGAGGNDMKWADITGSNFHLTAGSPAIDAASGCEGALDVDGEMRPQGEGCDFGADEFRP